MIRALLAAWRRMRSEDPWLPAAIAVGAVGSMVYSAMNPGGWW